MTNNKYLAQLEKNTRLKDEAEAERIVEEEMERSKLKRQAKKLEKEGKKGGGSWIGKQRRSSTRLGQGRGARRLEKLCTRQIGKLKVAKYQYQVT